MSSSGITSTADNGAVLNDVGFPVSPAEAWIDLCPSPIEMIAIQGSIWSSKLTFLSCDGTSFTPSATPNALKANQVIHICTIGMREEGRRRGWQDHNSVNV